MPGDEFQTLEGRVAEGGTSLVADRNTLVDLHVNGSCSGGLGLKN